MTDLAHDIASLFEQGNAALRDAVREAERGLWLARRVFVKYRDERTAARTGLERWIR